MHKNTLLTSVLFLLMLTNVVWAKDVLTFNGQLDFVNQQFDVSLDFDEKRSIQIKAQQKSKDDYFLKLSLEHVELPMCNLSTEVDSNFHSVVDAETGENIYQGDIRSKYSLVDFRPSRELTGKFSVKNKKIELYDVSFADYKMKGSLSLQKPYNVDLTFDLDDVAMDDFLDIWIKERDYSSAGPVSGRIRITGFIDHLIMKGNLQSHNGYVKNLNFDSLYLNVEGVYPQLQVVQSVVSQTDGMSYTFNGPINLKAGKKKFKSDIKELTFAPLVNESGSELEWTIKRVGEEDTGKTELKYFLRKGDGISQDSNEETAMFGIERSLKF